MRDFFLRQFRPRERDSAHPPLATTPAHPIPSHSRPAPAAQPQPVSQSHPPLHAPAPPPIPNTYRKSPPRRSRSRWLPWLAQQQHQQQHQQQQPPPQQPQPTSITPATPPAQTVTGPVDPSPFPPLPQPVSSRCPCDHEHHRVPTPPQTSYHYNTPQETPVLSSAANRPPTPSTHALSGYLPTVPDMPPQQLPHTPLPTPSNRPLQVHAANLVSQIQQPSAASSPSPTASYQQPAQPALNTSNNRSLRTNLSAPDAEAPPSAHGRRAVELHDYKNRVIVSVTMDDGVRLSPRNSNSRRRGSAWRVPSVNSSASSNSSSTSTSPTGSGSYPAHSHSDHQASSQDGDSGGEVGGPDIGVPSDSGSQDDDGSENNLQSLITEEDAKEAIEKNLTVGSPTERIQYGLSMVAGSDGSIRELDDDILCLIIDAMEGVLGQSVENPKILSDLHPDKLMEAHYVLANYHHERIRNHWMTAHADTALRHCREALLLMHGRERLNAQKAATLNVWASNVLLIDRNPGRIQKNIPLALKHLHAARVAMYAYTETNQKLSFDICLLIAEAHSQKADEPVCASLLQAYKAYCDAEDMLRMSEFDDGLHWMRLGCHQLQLMLRFLSHKRKAQVRKRPLCYQAEMVSCRKGFDSTDGVNDITPDATIARAEALRHRILRHLAVHPNEETGSAEPRDVVCTTHETVARAYLERAAIGEGQGIEDIRKAGQNVEKAISACERDNDFTGQRYSALRELADDIQDALHDVESFSDIQVAPKPATSEASEEYSLSVEIEE